MPRTLARSLASALLLLLMAAARTHAALPASPTYSLESNRANFKTGLSVSTAGDVNGDGYSDLLVGADGSTVGQAGWDLYLGRASGDPFASSQLAYRFLRAQFGVDVAAVGDIDNDGRDDVAVAWGSTMRVYRGSAAGIDTSSYFNYAWAGLTQSLYRIQVAPAGDVNGDGYDDVLLSHVEASGFNECAGTNNGAMIVFYGSSTGLSSSNSLYICGGAAGVRFGNDVHGAGDVNGDGYDDVIAGAPGASSTGEARLFMGGAGGLNFFYSLALTGDQNGMAFGAAVGPAGDVNGDGYADVIVGAP